jgi:hypothetical protein
MVCLSYIEGIEQYRVGRNSNSRSSDFFVSSMRRIFDEAYTEANLRDLYSEARCGLFHNGMTKGKVIIRNSFEPAIRFPDFERIEISPEKLLDIIEEDFENYLNELRNPENLELRDNFDRMFSIR